MSSPYTQPSITGYNSSPPASDGTESSSNQVDWDKHLDKIGGPIKTFAEAIDAAVLAAFGLEFGAAVLTKSGDYTVTTADRGRFISVTGTTTITLPVADTAGTGFPILVVNTGTGVVTIDGDSSETINGSVTQVLNPGAGAVLTSNGASWSGIVTAGIDSGSFTINWSGFTTSENSTIYYARSGSIVSLSINVGINATSNSVSLQGGVAELPATLRPTFTKRMLVPVRENGTVQLGTVSVVGNGQLAFGVGAEGTQFTNSGAKGFPSLITFTYFLD